jgi:hypothetical protein
MSSKIALDLGKFKHVKSDKNTTTLQHKDGHILTIAHNVMNPDMQKQLAALSPIAKENATTSQLNDNDGRTKLACGGKVQKFASKGDVQSQYDTSDQPDFNLSGNMPTTTSNIAPEQTGVVAGNYNTNPSAEAESLSRTQQQSKSYQDQLRAEKGLPPQQAEKPMQTADIASDVPTEQTPQPKAKDMTPGKQDDLGMGNYQSGLVKSYETEQAGIQAQAAAEGELGKQRAIDQQKYQESID